MKLFWCWLFYKGEKVNGRADAKSEEEEEEKPRNAQVDIYRATSLMLRSSSTSVFFFFQMLHVAYFFCHFFCFVSVRPDTVEPGTRSGSPVLRSACWEAVQWDAAEVVFRCSDEMAPERLRPWPPWRRLALGGVHSTSSLCARRGPSPLRPRQDSYSGRHGGRHQRSWVFFFFCFFTFFFFFFFFKALALPGYSWLWRHGGSWLVAANCWHPSFSCRPSCHCVVSQSRV